MLWRIKFQELMENMSWTRFLSTFLVYHSQKRAYRWFFDRLRAEIALSVSVLSKLSSNPKRHLKDKF